MMKLECDVLIEKQLQVQINFTKKLTNINPFEPSNFANLIKFVLLLMIWYEV